MLLRYILMFHKQTQIIVLEEKFGTLDELILRKQRRKKI